MRRCALLLLPFLLTLAAPAAAQEHCIVGGMQSQCPYDEVTVLGGPGDARVHGPTDLSVAADGRLAVADGGARRALVLRPDGSSIFATNPGDVWATAVAFAPDGSLLVAEDGAIHRYSASGARQQTITAGLRGDGAYARSVDLATDAVGRIYAAVDRTVLVWGADGTLQRTIERPEDVWTLAADGDGRLFVGRSSTGSVEQIGASGEVVRTILTGTSHFGLATDGKLLSLSETEIETFDASGDPAGSVPRPASFAGSNLVATADRLSVSDQNGDVVRAATRAGTALPDLGVEAGAGLNQPEALAAAPDGRLWVADHDNHRVVGYDAAGAFAGVVRHYGDDQPLAIAYAAEELFVTTEAGRVERLGVGGDVRAAWEIAGPPYLSGIGVSPSGDVWVRDRTSMQRFSPAGAPLSNFTVTYSQPYFTGHGMTVGPDGNLYVADDYSVMRYSPDGALLGRLSVSLPEGIAVDPGGNVHVAAQRGFHLLSPSGAELMRFAEYDTSAGRVHLPWAVAVDERRHIFVADRWTHRVFRFRLRAPSAPAPPAPPAPKPAVVPPPASAKLTAARTVATASNVRVSVACAAACTGSLRLVPAKGRGALSGAVKFALKPGAQKKLTLKLTRSARRVLRRKRRLKASFAATLAGGTPARRAVTLKYRR